MAIMLHDYIRKTINSGTFMFAANHYEFSEDEVGFDSGKTDAEFLISIGTIRTHFEVNGLNEKYIKNNFNIENRSKIFHESGKIEIVFDWKPSKNSDNEPTSIDFHVKDSRIFLIEFWFLVGDRYNAHTRRITFNVSHIDYCPNCYNTFQIDYLSNIRECPYCGNVMNILR